MIRRIKYILTAIALASLALVPATPAVAASFKNDACSGITSVAGGSCASGGGTINKIMQVALNLFSLVVGFAAVLVIIISGLRFITSGGDPSNVAKARAGLLYALVGVVLVSLSEALVHFVLAKVK